MIASPAAMKIQRSRQAALDESDARSRELGRNAFFTSSFGSLRKVPAVHIVTRISIGTLGVGNCPEHIIPNKYRTFSSPSGGAKVRRKEPLPRNVPQIGFTGVVIYDVLRRLADQIESEYCARIQMV